MSDPEPYWCRHLRRHNKVDLTLTQTGYPQQKIVTIDVSKIIDKQVYDALILRPLGQIDEINDQAHKYKLWPTDQKMTIRFVNITHKIKICDLRGPQDEYNLRSIVGIVKRISDVQSKVVSGEFTCANGHPIPITPKNDRIDKPKSCPAVKQSSHTKLNQILTNAAPHNNKPHPTTEPYTIKPQLNQSYTNAEPMLNHTHTNVTKAILNLI